MCSRYLECDFIFHTYSYQFDALNVTFQSQELEGTGKSNGSKLLHQVKKTETQNTHKVFKRYFYASIYKAI